MSTCRPCTTQLSGEWHDRSVRSRWFRPTIAPGLLVLSLLVTGCTVPVSGQAAPGVVLERRGPAGVVPTGLDRFYGQALGWGDCTDYATTAIDQQLFSTTPGIDCARLTVPLDYSKPDGKTITVGLLRKKAADSSQRIGSLVINPGGPGGSGMEAAASLAPRFSTTELGNRFDLVGFDPRGVGASTPAIHCLTDSEQDARRAENEHDMSPQGVAQQNADLHDYVDKCTQRTGVDVLANVGARDVAKDLDVLRSALGDPKLTYLGYSYGTLLGSDYAEDFPANARALLLDGAIDPNENPFDADVAQSAGFDQAFRDFAAWCVTQQGCVLGSDAGQAAQQYRTLILPLLSNPVPVGDGRKLTFSDATTGTIQALYAKELWPLLKTGLSQLKAGRGAGLMALADIYFGRDPDGKYSNEQDAFNAIYCVDSSRITDPNAVLDKERRTREAAPLFDDGQPLPAQPPADRCAFWPVPPTSQPHVPKAPGLPPVLVVSTTNDPATPYQSGVILAADLHGFLLSYQGTQHTAFLQQSPIACVDNVGIRYLVDLQLPSADPHCS